MHRKLLVGNTVETEGTCFQFNKTKCLEHLIYRTTSSHKTNTDINLCFIGDEVYVTK